MTKKKIFITLVALLVNLTMLKAQDSLFTAIAKKNSSSFSKKATGFDGLGWQNILDKAKSSGDVLIGEDHFTNEIPFFVSALAKQVKFDNFIAEIDPYAAKLMQTKLSTLSAAALKNYVHTYGNTFSFYALEPELQLLKQLVDDHTQLYGTDQILLVADRLICNELMQTTKNPRAKVLYQLIRDQSKVHFDRFLNDQSKPFYMLTPDFEKNVSELAKLKLSVREQKIIADLKLTAKIYKTGSHHLRIQLMKNQLMAQYQKLKGKKNLYKFGANHMAKGESVMHVIYDIGNLVNNLADGRYQNSFHLMVIGKSGEQASPFQGFPAEKIDANTGMLKSLSPFFKLVNDKEWQVFDLRPLNEAIEEKKLSITDPRLLRIIKGFDMLVVIPELTAAKFPNE
jgi:hypothetical protein